ncbi:MAG: hypothetical protein K0U54_06560, partial [Bacteroidetes bacterium]|nr:hypothetical protein [Bacteroidota bacterium]
IMIGQNSDLSCVTEEDFTANPASPYSASVDLSLFPDPVVYNVYFWGINRADGTSGEPLTDERALQAVANLNTTFNEFNIFFKYRGQSSFNSGDHYALETPSEFTTLVNYAKNNGYHDPKAFNIYVFGAGSFGGVAYYNRTVCAVKRTGLLGSTLVHEVAHNLHIKHTRSGAGTQNCEHVERNPFNIAFNADTHGDQVVDTAAVPPTLYDDSCACYPSIDDNCNYVPVGIQTDCIGTAYDISQDDLRNAMSNAYDCQDLLFTPGQGVRMREALNFDTHGEFDLAEATVSELFIPYQGTYTVNPGSIDPPLFQPGFDYQFVECCCDYPVPSQYDDTSFSFTGTSLLTIDKFETNFQTITHPNHSAIRILQLEDNSGPLFQPRKCYDNNEGLDVISGKVYYFKDNMLNMNVLIDDLSREEINDPNLVSNLAPGLYKIEKQYKDGTKNETVIYKNK